MWWGCHHAALSHRLPFLTDTRVLTCLSHFLLCDPEQTLPHSGLSFPVLPEKETLTLILARLRPQHGEDPPITLQSPHPLQVPYIEKKASGCFYTEKLSLIF